MSEQVADIDQLIDIRRNLEWIEAEFLRLKQEWLRQKYDPNQPRIPAGSPDAGRWTSGGDITGNIQMASRRISRAQEDFCERQMERDIFQCKMVGLKSCYAQANLRYANCLRGLPIPPLNY